MQLVWKFQIDRPSSFRDMRWPLKISKWPLVSTTLEVGCWKTIHFVRYVKAIYCENFKLIRPLFFELSRLLTNKQTNRQTEPFNILAKIEDFRQVIIGAVWDCIWQCLWKGLIETSSSNFDSSRSDHFEGQDSIFSDFGTFQYIGVRVRV